MSFWDDLLRYSHRNQSSTFAVDQLAPASPPAIAERGTAASLTTPTTIDDRGASPASGSRTFDELDPGYGVEKGPMLDAEVHTRVDIEEFRADESVVREIDVIECTTESIRKHLGNIGVNEEQQSSIIHLATEHLLPVVETIVQHASEQLERANIVQHFGGDEKWRIVSQQIKSWAEANLDTHTYAHLCGSASGVKTIHRMMKDQEPRLVPARTASGPTLDEDSLKAMIRDPRYWRDKDPAFVENVTNLFRARFGSSRSQP